MEIMLFHGSYDFINYLSVLIFVFVTDNCEI